jgi:hypothetical protein
MQLTWLMALLIRTQSGGGALFAAVWATMSVLELTLYIFLSKKNKTT